MVTIVSRTPQGCKEKVYYYHKTYRVKIDPSKTGKGRGSGPSKVISDDIYFRKAEERLEAVKKAQKPKSLLPKEIIEL